MQYANKLTDEELTEIYKVKYEKFYNEKINFYETKSFNSLETLADWLFGLVDAFDGNYKRMSFDEKIKTQDEQWFTYQVELIEKDGNILYSTGEFTNGVSYCNDEIKQWLIECKERMNE